MGRVRVSAAAGLYLNGESGAHAPLREEKGTDDMKTDSLFGSIAAYARSLEARLTRSQCGTRAIGLAIQIAKPTGESR
jgi:hypothetical protein